MEPSAWLIVATVAFSTITSIAVALLVLRRVRLSGGLARAMAARGRPSAAEHPSVAYRVRAPTLRTRTALILCLVALADIVITAGLAVYFQRENIRRAQLLEREGVAARATVLGKEVEEDDEGYDDYYVTYAFRANPGRADEQEVTRRDGVSEEFFARVEVGGTIEVVYARSEPTLVCFAADYRPGAVNWLPAALGTALTVPSVGLLLWFFSLYRRAVRLDEEGVVGLAEVLDRYEAASGDSTSWYIACQMPGGEPSRVSVGRALYDQSPVGSQVTIRYLPDAPHTFRLGEV